MDLNEVKQILDGYSDLFIHAYIFGSVAAGTQDAYSDVDLILVRDTSAPFFDRLEEVMDLRMRFAAADILIYTPDELSAMLTEEGRYFIKSAISEGVPVEGKQGRGPALAVPGGKRP
jgi:predicted nucleotidyltransferase